MPPPLALALDDSLPTPLTSRNLRPRSETRSSRSSSSSRSRGASARPTRLGSKIMSQTQPTAGPSSHKRQRSDSASSSGRKRVRVVDDVEEFEDDLASFELPQPSGIDLEDQLDELQDDEDLIDFFQWPQARAERTAGPSRHLRALDAEDEVESILLPNEQEESSFDSSILRPNGPGSENSPKRSPVSSPSLARLLHPENVPIIIDSPANFTVALGSNSQATSSQILVDSPAKSTMASGSGSKARKHSRSASPQLITVAASAPKHPSSPPPPPPQTADLEPLSAYSCPICFFPPTNATLTPCGHVCCGACLFTAVKTMTQRAAMQPLEASVPRCPVCRAQIPGWDGRGGGVIGLKVRAVFSL
ncbi:hypothetical protein R3P38DRAFT_2899228 [Favolaschia claudopus]|uniref:RING-type domain-containing protein n=1 Tax=Favolaschia claudopus TaxID=2862362 RepID=A0AAW0CK43_9AGAR